MICKSIFLSLVRHMTQSTSHNFSGSIVPCGQAVPTTHCMVVGQPYKQHLVREYKWSKVKEFHTTSMVRCMGECWQCVCVCELEVTLSARGNHDPWKPVNSISQKHPKTHQLSNGSSSHKLNPCFPVSVHDVGQFSNYTDGFFGVAISCLNRKSTSNCLALFSLVPRSNEVNRIFVMNSFLLGFVWLVWLAYTQVCSFHLPFVRFHVHALEYISLSKTPVSPLKFLCLRYTLSFRVFCDTVCNSLLCHVCHVPPHRNGEKLLNHLSLSL